MEVDFGDPSSAFRDKSTWEVARALAVLRLCAIDPIADHSEKLMSCVPESVLRSTIYSQFVGGDSEAELRLAMSRVREAGLKAMLAATMEEEDESVVLRDDRVLDSNCARISRCVRLAAQEEGPGALVQMKLSGLVRPHLLVSLGHAYSKNGLSSVEEIARQITEGGTQQMASLEGFLSKEDSEALSRAVGRLRTIGKEAESSGVSVLVDAESTPLNDGLSALALAGAAAFNARRPVIWNTYQCYLKDAEPRVRRECGILGEGGVGGVCFGAKVVRGAYMQQERTRTPDPVCDDRHATTRNYHRVLSMLLEKTGPRCQMIVATHNEDTIQFTIKKLKDADGSRVSFGQLYGMADHISYPLARAGFAVHKSIPVGSVRETLPYLARRAAENRAVMLGARAERALLATEFGRRLTRTLFRR